MKMTKVNTNMFIPLESDKHSDKQDNMEVDKPQKIKAKNKEGVKSVSEKSENIETKLNEEVKEKVLKKSVPGKASPKRLTRKRNHQKLSEIEENSLKNTPRKTRAKAKPIIEVKKKTPKKNSKPRVKVLKESSISSISHSSLKKPAVISKLKSVNSNKEKVNKASSELQKIALIRTKLDNVLKEKFTSIDLVAQENSNKIFDDFAFLSNLEIDIKSL